MRINNEAPFSSENIKNTDRDKALFDRYLNSPESKTHRVRLREINPDMGSAKVYVDGEWVHTAEFFNPPATRGYELYLALHILNRYYRHTDASVFESFLDVNSPEEVKDLVKDFARALYKKYIFSSNEGDVLWKKSSCHIMNKRYLSLANTSNGHSINGELAEKCLKKINRIRAFYYIHHEKVKASPVEALPRFTIRPSLKHLKTTAENIVHESLERMFTLARYACKLSACLSA